MTANLASSITESVADEPVHSGSLLRAFLNTEYRVLADPVMVVQIGQRWSTLDHYAGKAGWAIITAYNAQAKTQSDAANQLAAAKLGLRIQQIQTGLQVKTIHHDAAVDAQTRWPDEHGWLFGFDRVEDVHRIAIDFGQLGVVTGKPEQPAMLWLYGNGWPAPLPEHVQQIKP